MITYSKNGKTYNISPDPDGMYDATSCIRNIPGVISNMNEFTRNNNNQWKGNYSSKKGRYGGTFGSAYFTLALLQRLGCDSIIHYGQEYRVVKAERVENLFGDCVVEEMFSNYTIQRQVKVLNYRLDFYIPELNIAIEYDEDQHKSFVNREKDDIRESDIKSVLGCIFIRIPHKRVSK